MCKDKKCSAISIAVGIIVGVATVASAAYFLVKFIQRKKREYIECGYCEDYPDCDECPSAEDCDERAFNDASNEDEPETESDDAPAEESEETAE